MAELQDVMKARKTVYDVGSNTDITAEDVEARLDELVSLLPSAFNIQGTRYVIVSGKANEEVWNIIGKAQKEALSEEDYKDMEWRFENPKNGLGTVLLFESKDAINSLPTSELRGNIYKENNHGIAAYAVWLILTEMGLGASLQHHNIGFEEGYDKEVREYLGLPDDWEMLAQMPVGSIETGGGEKDKLDPDDQVILIKEAK